MNHKTLKDSAHNLESLDAGTVQDLIEMTKRFPYFAWPFVLLAKQYQQKQDFRAEALMHQAALRVHDRSWLYTFSHNIKPAIAHPILQPSEPKINIQTPVIEPTVTIETVTPTPVEAFSETIATEIQKPISEPPALVETETPTLVIEPTVNVDTETPTPVEVFSETIATEIQTPVIEPTVKLEIEKPILEPPALVETETPITPLPRTNSFVSDPKRFQTKNEPRPLFTPERGQVYDLERIFSEKQPVEQEPHEGKASSDFYAWLNAAPPKATPPDVIPQKPTPGPSSEIPESIAQQKSIIENFLINKPSISRPKQEFFKPEKAQKKGEVLSGAIVTETLAQIYLKQGNPQKAIWAYQQLQLKFPEKKTYFANLISQIEIEQNKS